MHDLVLHNETKSFDWAAATHGVLMNMMWLPCMNEIATSGNHTLALKEDGTVKMQAMSRTLCW
jgi:hypothetical protein